MTWTDAAPTWEGVYYFRGKFNYRGKDHELVCEPVRVDGVDVLFFGDDVEYNISRFQGQWYGPLLLPPSEERPPATPGGESNAITQAIAIGILTMIPVGSVLEYLGVVIP